MKRLLFSCLLVILYCQINAATLSTAQSNKRISRQKCEEYGENFKTCTFDEDSNNDKAEPGKYPHMVLLGYGENNNGNSTKWQCIGTLISENYVLTAAHCTKNRPNNILWIIRLGAYALNVKDENHIQDVKISAVFKHPNYKLRDRYHDVALLKLEKPVEFNKFVHPICLPDLNLNYDSKFIISGWGLRPGIEDTKSMETYLLQKKNVKLISNEDCNKHYMPNRFLENGITENLLCTHDFEENICEILSGSPLQVKNKENSCVYSQIGMLSFGKTSCIPSNPIVYTKIASYVDWIENVVWK